MTPDLATFAKAISNAYHYLQLWAENICHHSKNIFHLRIGDCLSSSCSRIPKLKRKSQYILIQLVDYYKMDLMI